MFNQTIEFNRVFSRAKINHSAFRIISILCNRNRRLTILLANLFVSPYKNFFQKLFFPLELLDLEYENCVFMNLKSQGNWYDI